MGRLNGTFGDRLKNRERRQADELAPRSKRLNDSSAIGMPVSIWG